MARPTVKLVSGAVPKLLKGEAIQRRLTQEAREHAGSIPNVRIPAPFVGRTRARQQAVAQTPAAAEALRRAFRR